MKLLNIYSILLGIPLAIGCSQFRNQGNCETKKLKNSLDTLELYVSMVSCDTCQPITNLGYRVVSLSQQHTEISTIPDEFLELSKSCWLELLNDSSTSWKSNLVLYEIHETDAITLFGISKEYWIQNEREQDIKYWQEFLETKR